VDLSGKIYKMGPSGIQKWAFLYPYKVGLSGTGLFGMGLSGIGSF